MLSWLAAIAAGLLAAAVPYGGDLRSPRTMPLALLRAVGGTLIVALLLDAPAGRRATRAPWVAIDGSESIERGHAGGDACWKHALDSARAAGGTVYRFGDSLRADAGRAAPSDHASSVRAVVDRAVATGTAVVVITDGELDDADALPGLPSGSRVALLACAAGRDMALAALDVPGGSAVGDTVAARVTLVSGAAGAPAGRLDLDLAGERFAHVDVPALAAGARSTVELRGVITARDGPALLRASWAGRGDVEPRNDTLAVTVDVSRGAAAVFVSTRPDFDAREAVAALRGVTSLPTRAFYRVAPGVWRVEGSLAPVTEGAVRSAFAAAPVVVLHGDTAIFGAPRAATRGGLLLFAGPQGDEGEWFARAVPASPLSSGLAGLPFDSLPPLDVTAPPAMPRGQWEGLVARRGGAQGESRPVLVGWTEPRHIAVLGASGFWRWRFRGGARAGAYQAFFGTLFDWLASSRADLRAAIPDGRVMRAGLPMVWRRGAGQDSVVALTLRRRGATARVQMVTLHFDRGATVAESAPLAPGVYDVVMPGGRSVVAVNASRELVPRAATVHGGTIGGSPPSGTAPALRDLGWAYLLLVGVLCAEWVGRRRAGLG